MPENPHIESQGARPGKDGGAQLNVNDLGGTQRRSAEAGTETPAKPQDSQQNPSDLKLPTENKDNPFKAPESQEARKETIERHKEQTTPTGFAGPKTYFDAAGKPIRGIEQYDAKSGERLFYAHEKGSKDFTPFAVKDNGRTLQKIDKETGKTTGETLEVKPGKSAFDRDKGDTFKQEKWDRREKQDKPAGESEHPHKFKPEEAKPGKTFDAFKPNQNPKDGENPQGFRPGHKDGEGKRDWQKPDWQKPEAQKELPKYEHKEFRPENPQGIRPGERPSFRPEERPAFRPEQRPEFHRPEFQRPDFQRHEMQRAQFENHERQQWRAMQERLQDRAPLRETSWPEHGRMRDLNFRALEGRNANLVDFPPNGQGRFDLRAERFLDARAEGRGFTRATDAQPGLLSGLRSGQEIPGLSDRGILNLRLNELPSGRQIHENGLGLRTQGDIFSNISRAIQPGDFSVKLSGRAESSLSQAQSRNLEAGKALAADFVGINIAQQFAQLIGRPADRAPGVEQQVKQNIKDAPTGIKPDSAVQDNALNLARTLNQRSTEAAAVQQNLTAKAMQQNNEAPVSKVREGDISGKDQAAARAIEANKALDSAKAQPATNTVRTAEAASAANNQAEQARAVRREAESKDTAANQNTNQSQIDRVVYAEQKSDLSSKNVSDSKSNFQPDDKRQAGKDEEELKSRKIKEEEEKEKEEQQMALMLSNKIKELAEKEKAKQKEKEEAQDKHKKDPKQKARLRYKVKESDTLGSIALKFLSDASLAPAIFHINRTAIPVITHGGKLYAMPPANLTIWIPCDDDIDYFKSTGAGKKYQQLNFDGIKFASAEEELQARFGRRWYGPAESDASASEAKELNQAETQRRQNIASALGLSESSKEGSLSNGRLSYQVRLGEGLKSIALRHPLLKNVDFWKLLAAVNGLSAETDEKGAPIAQLKRGMKILLPSKQEIEDYRSAGVLPTALALPKAALSNAAGANPFA